MDTSESLFNVNDFERRIAAMQTDKKDEKFVREFVSEIALDCPLYVLTRMAKAMLECRKSELSERGERN